MKRSSGFTVIELLVAIFILSVGAILFFNGQASAQAAARDTARKTAVNAIYYNLEEVFYKTNGYYPQTASDKTLTAMDPSLFKDPSNLAINAHGSTLHYKGLSCSVDGHCKGYQLSANLEHEADYVKNSRNS